MNCSSNTDENSYKTCSTEQESYLYKTSFYDMVMYLIFMLCIYVICNMTKIVFMQQSESGYMCMVLSDTDVIIYKTLTIITTLISIMMIYIWITKIPLYTCKSATPEETVYDTIVYLLFPIVYCYVSLNLLYILNYGTKDTFENKENVQIYCMEISPLNLVYLKISIIFLWILLLLLLIITTLSTFKPVYGFINSCNIVFNTKQNEKL
jgi:hypothetical protein